MPPPQGGNAKWVLEIASRAMKKEQTMKTRTPILLILLTIVLTVLLGCSQASPTPSGGATPTSGATTGRAVFAIADEAVDIGAVSKILITVDSLQVHAQGGAWIVLTSTPQTFDLMDLKAQGVGQLLAEVQSLPGIYDQIELSISKIVVVDAQGEHEAKLPSNKLQLKGELKVAAGATATAHFDFLADQSLHRTGEGRYIFAPVVHLETRAKANAEVRANKEVRIAGGVTDTDARLGMDAEGSIDAGIRITPDAILTVSASGKVMQTKGQALTTGTLKAVDVVSGTVTVLTRAGTELTLYLASDTEVKLSDKSAKSADLAGRIGAEVVLRYNAETKSLSKIIVASDYKAKADVSADLGLSGEIKSVDIAKGTMTITTDSGASVTLKLGADARINLGGVSTAAGLQGKSGERIKIGYDANSGQLKKVESETEVEVEASLNGTLKAVNPADGTITVTTAAGTDVTLKVASESRLMANGSLSTLIALNKFVGAQVSVEYRLDTKVVREVGVRGAAKGSAEVTGTIKAVNPAQGTVTIVTPEGAEVVLNVNAASSLLADGTISSVFDLRAKIGQELHADYDTTTKGVISLKARAETNAKATGVLKDVDVQAGKITMTTESGDIVLRVDVTTELEAGGDDTTLKEMTRLLGAQVIAEFNAQSMTATEIKAQGRAVLTGKASGIIKTVDAAAGSITIASEAGGTITLQVSADTAILMSGSATSLANLAAKTGSRVVVEYAQENKLASRIIIIGPAAASGSASTRVEVAGVLKSVNVLAGTIIVGPSSGKEVFLNVTSDTKILVEGRYATLAALVAMVGSNVAVQYDAQTSTALSIESSGHVSGSVTVAGAIKAVDTAAGTLTIAAASGANVTLKVSGQTRLLLNGAAATLASLATQIGARVKVEYSAQTNTAIAVQVEAEGKAEAEIAGTLKTVNTLAGSLTVASSNAVEFAFTVTAQTKVKMNGAEATLAGLANALGGQIKVKYNAQTRVATEIEVVTRASTSGSGGGGGTGGGTGTGSGSSSSTNSTTKGSGTLKAVDPIGGTITIAMEGRADLVLKASTAIVAQLKVGSRVSVQYDVNKMTVIKVDG